LSARTVLLAAGAFPLAVALSVSQGIRQQVGQDFHVFWQAGRNFATGLPLYHDYLPGARQFKYPPFAAFVFQLLAVFPLPVAATLFSLFNLALWLAAVYLIRDIVARSFPERNPGPVPLVLAVAFSAQFFLDNFHHVQMNGVIFVLVLLGIDAYLRGNDVRAAAYLVTATAIKITPISMSSPRTALAFLGLSLLGTTPASAIALQALVTALPPSAQGATAGLLVDAVSDPWVRRYSAPGSR
jgi:hypothetical protein